MKTITVVGGDLFKVALEQLGDATQWIRIAELNRINDPFLTGIVELKLPNINANTGGGIVDQ